MSDIDFEGTLAWYEDLARCARARGLRGSTVFAHPYRDQLEALRLAGISPYAAFAEVCEPLGWRVVEA